MFPAEFSYHRADSLDHALQLLSQHEDAKLLAGGHSLIPMMKVRLAQPATIIDIGRISDLRGIETGNGSIRIGALTTHRELNQSTELMQDCRLLAEAAGKVGDPQVRAKGTIGGNIAHADPASDLPAVLLALDATMHIVGPEGERSVDASNFFIGLLQTALAESEVLTAIEVPALHGGCCYLKAEHPASGYAVCGAAAIVRTTDTGAVESARLCFNGVASTPVDASGLLSGLVGSVPDEPSIAAALAELEIVEPLSDLYASGNYRTVLARTYGKRALLEAAGHAAG